MKISSSKDEWWQLEMRALKEDMEKKFAEQERILQEEIDELSGELESMRAGVED